MMQTIKSGAQANKGVKGTSEPGSINWLQ